MDFPAPADERTEDILTVISSATRQTLDMSAHLLDVLPKLAARALNARPRHVAPNHMMTDWPRGVLSTARRLATMNVLVP